MSVDTPEDYLLERARWYYRVLVSEEHSPCRAWPLHPEGVPDVTLSLTSAYHSTLSYPMSYYMLLA